ncbi:hypothetical protein [Escherichia coli]|nr:hypothetical protein [Escherichia coli]
MGSAPGKDEICRMAAERFQGLMRVIALACGCCSAQTGKLL